MADEQVTLTAHCLCKANVFTAQIAKSKLPLSAHACHCNSCRYQTGAMYSIDANWPVPASQVDTSALKSYAFSDRIETLFCGTCSTPMFFAHPQDPDAELVVFTGTLKNDTGDILKITDHIYVNDTIDGGATMWLRKPNADGTEAKRYKDRSEGETMQELPFEWPGKEFLTEYGKKTPQDQIPIQCKCKGVDFVLHSGGYEDKKPEELPWFVHPETLKLYAGLCVCDSCRLFSGVDLYNWTFAELSKISFPDGTTLPKSTHDLKALVDAGGPSIGTLRYYSSSPDVQRYFCSNCSACVFFATDRRDFMVDVAVGLLRASEGARAESCLMWRLGKVTFADAVKGGWREGFVKQVLKESEEWRVERGHPLI